MTKLNATAKATLRAAGVSQAAWARANFMRDGKWSGDQCGCPDDRCANGFHHFGADDCGCLPVLIEQYFEWLRGAEAVMFDTQAYEYVNRVVVKAGWRCPVTARQAEPVSVTTWAELARRRDKKLPGSLRVLVGGQHAGAVWREDGSWHAQAHGLNPGPQTDHEDAEAALAALLRSPWARRLGARAASRVFWSAKAGRLAGRS